MTKFDISEWPDWIDSEDVITKLKISPRTLQRWRINGIIPYSRLNGRCYYRITDILKILHHNYNGEEESEYEEQ